MRLFPKSGTIGHREKERDGQRRVATVVIASGRGRRSGEKGYVWRSGEGAAQHLHGANFSTKDAASAEEIDNLVKSRYRGGKSSGQACGTSSWQAPCGAGRISPR